MIIIDGTPLSIEAVEQIAKGEETLNLSSDEQFISRIERGRVLFGQLLSDGQFVYGVNTGLGDSCNELVPVHLLNDLPVHLYTYHGCGMGAFFDAQTARSILTVLMVSLSYGHSAVRMEVLEKIECLLNSGVVPLIPEEGSVGASGDLTPMSYVAAVLCGEREVIYDGEIKKTIDVFQALGITPLILLTKESLAVMNGTAVMTGLACMAFQRASYLSRLSAMLSAMALLVTLGNAHHFDDFLFQIKPHPGQRKVARWLRNDLRCGVPEKNLNRLQDRYSIRCAPHVIGTLEDTLPWLRQLIETELNSVCDNPVVSLDTGELFNGGNFYGGHIALAMDTLKSVMANIADLLDRQVAQMVDPKLNHGLPANLKGAQGERAAVNHGFKAVQIAVSAWTAEALKQTMPASAFSRSTECHNQDKVSMGTIAARDCLRVLQLTEQVASASLLVCCQGLELRFRQKELSLEQISPDIQGVLESVRTVSPFLEEDRALDGELHAVLTFIKNRHWSLPA